MTTSWHDILDFWYSDRIRPHWFDSSPALDREIRDHYEPLWTRAAAGGLDHWQAEPEGSLALVIVLDQFPLNMFRGAPASFATERQAVRVTLQAVDKGFDARIDRQQLGFLFMPLMHSEVLAEQELSVALYEKHELTANLDFARHHRDLIRRFGRFPHRNAILGRESTPAEREYLGSGHAFTG